MSTPVKISTHAESATHVVWKAKEKRWILRRVLKLDSKNPLGSHELQPIFGNCQEQLVSWPERSAGCVGVQRKTHYPPHKVIQPSGHKRRGWLFSVCCLWRKAVIFASCLIRKKLIYHFDPPDHYCVLSRGTQINLDGGSQRSPKAIICLFIIKIKKFRPFI